MPRLFAAIEVPDEVADELLPRMARLPGARWRPREALHITLRFFVDVQGSRARDLEAELARITAGPFPLALAGVGAFGDPHQSQTVWAGVAESAGEVYPVRRLLALRIVSQQAARGDSDLLV
jgi:2'-5' RNA ligase